MKTISIQSFQVGAGQPLILIAGPCVIENRDIVLRTASEIKEIAVQEKINVVFKSSYKKANRTSAEGFVGIGMDEALSILAEVKQQFGLPILTDIHTEKEAAIAAEVADVLQIPAFLCRQTDLLFAAGKTGRVVNIKKGQFLAPDEIRYPIEKVASTGNTNIMVTERGTTFGYHNLVVDMRGLRIMRQFGYPVILDVTHSVQLPGAGEGKSSGQPEFISSLARAGAAAGIDGLFVETHPNPSQALSDAASQLPLDQLASLVRQVKTIDGIVKEHRWA